MRSRWIAGVLVLAVLGGGIVVLAGGDRVGSPPHGEGRRGGEAPPPRAPREIRVLLPAEIPEAVPLVDALGEAPLLLGARRDLAGLYREAGFRGAAEFFEDTVRVAGGQEIDAAPVESPIGWSAKAEVLDDHSSAVADRIARLVQEGAVDRALAEAQSELESGEPALGVVVQWADAVAWKAAVEPAEVSPEAFEAAVRIVLTALEEKVPLPRGIGTRAAGYARLSTVFAATGDPLSALTASLIGIRHCRIGSEGDDPGPAFRSMLCEQAAALSRELGVAPAGWPDDPAYRSVCGEEL